MKSATLIQSKYADRQWNPRCHARATCAIDAGLERVDRAAPAPCRHPALRKDGGRYMPILRS